MDLYKTRYANKKSSRHFRSGQADRKFRDDMQHRSFRNSSRSSRFDRSREMYDATCGDCGAECQIPFEPKFNRPVYCSRCYEKNEPHKSRPRASGNDIQSRSYGYRKKDSLTGYDKPPKSKSKKFQKKQESLYSNGSEKFYLSLKEKLFEILGGKVCSSCGFRDERALGFNHVYDGDAFDRIRRGGFASSWGKYISEPELAKKELRVLCLNCNEIREPQRKTEHEKPKSHKKSRYFPR